MTAPSRILLIEDDRIYASLATLLLKGIGHMVTWASTADEGIRMAGEELPDLILMDMNLLGMDGLATVRLLRQNPRLAGIPVVAITADRIWTAAEGQRAREAGFNDYVEKPNNLNGFRAVIDPHLPPS